MIFRARSSRSESGESLIEILVAVAILGLTAASLLGAVMLGASASTVDRKAVQAQRLLKTWSEQIVSATTDATYTPCAATGNAMWLAARPVDAAVSFAPSVLAVQYWNGTAFVSGACVAGVDDVGVQRVQLQVSVSGGATPAYVSTAWVTLRKPCTAC